MKPEKLMLLGLICLVMAIAADAQAPLVTCKHLKTGQIAQFELGCPAGWLLIRR